MKSFALALGFVFAASAANAKLWTPDYELWDQTDRPFPTRLSSGLTFQQCLGFLREGAAKVEGFQSLCKSPTRVGVAVMLCVTDERRPGYHHCFLTGSGPEPR